MASMHSYAPEVLMRSLMGHAVIGVGQRVSARALAWRLWLTKPEGLTGAVGLVGVEGVELLPWG